MPSTDRARQLADDHERDRAGLESLGTRDFTRVLRRLQIEVLRAFRRGDSLAVAINDATRDMPALLADAMVAGHLKGRVRAVTDAASKIGRQTVALQSGYDHAIEFLMRQANLTDLEVQSLRSVYGDRALSLTGDITTALERAVRDAANRAIGEGLPTAQGAQRVREAMQAMLGTLGRPHLGETIYRTQLQTAYSAGRVAANQAPEIDSILWGYEYVTVGDDRVRPSHAVLDGLRRPKDDPIWDRIMPPNGYNCRCSVIEIFKDDPIASPAGDLGPQEFEGIMVVPGPDRGFDFNPGKVLVPAA